MLLLAAVGIPPSEYERMPADRADALTLRVIEQRKAEHEARGKAHDADMNAVLSQVGAVVKSLGSVQKQLGRVQETIARRPSL